MLGDTDAKGKRHMDAVRKSVEPLSRDLIQVALPSECRDVSHYLESHSSEDLVKLVGDEWLQSTPEI